MKNLPFSPDILPDKSALAISLVCDIIRSEDDWDLVFRDKTIGRM